MVDEMDLDEEGGGSNAGRQPYTLETVPFDVYHLIAAFLFPHELAALCRVSRCFQRVFRPILWRNLRFRWPVGGRRHRFDGDRLLCTDFDRHAVSLEMELPLSAKANCSWPILMNKHRRTRFLRRLKTGAGGSPGKLRSLVLQQHSRKPSEITRRYLEMEKLPAWAGHLLDGFQNLQRLTLAGSAFLDAAAVAGLLLASRNLRVLELYSRPEGYWGVRYRGDSGARIAEEQCRVFWAETLDIVSREQLRPRSPPGGDVLRAANDAPLLRLHTLAVDEYAIADFGRLTDLSHLRCLRLLNKTQTFMCFADMNHHPRACELELDPAAASFYGATGLACLEVATLHEAVLDLIGHLQSANPGALTELRTDSGMDWLAPRVLALPGIRRVRLFSRGNESAFDKTKLERSSRETPLVIEHLELEVDLSTAHERERKDEVRAEREKEVEDGLCLYPLLVSVLLRAFWSDRDISPTLLRRWAGRILKAHEEAQFREGRKSRLLEVSFELREAGPHAMPALRQRRYVFFKSWDSRVQPSTEQSKAAGEEEEGDEAGPSASGWHVVGFSHIVPRGEDTRY